LRVRTACRSSRSSRFTSSSPATVRQPHRAARAGS
jgi:hypothetical protein